MFKTFFDDLTYMPKSKFNAKYTVPFFMFVLIVVLLGQILTILTPLDQFSKETGRIINTQTIITSWTHHRNASHDSPNYALAITLDDTRSFNIQEQKVMINLASILKVGDYVTIYYPTNTLKIISAGLIRDVSQVESAGKVLYSWQNQQAEQRVIVIFLIAVLAFLYWLKGYLRNAVDMQKML